MRKAGMIAAPSLACALLMTSWGCSEKPSVDTTSAEGSVSGTVTIRGKPMGGGEIAFDPSNHLRPDAKPRRTTVGKDGKYTITTLQGQNSIRISGPALSKDPQLAYGLHTFNVQASDNTFNIELPPPSK